MCGTMEEKIYDRQINKLGLSKRVIDGHPISRHFDVNTLKEFYNVENIEPKDERPLLMLPEDRLFAEQLKKYPDRIWKYHDHDIFLQNKSEESLSKGEKEVAWTNFEVSQHTQRAQGTQRTLKLSAPSAPSWTEVEVAAQKFEIKKSSWSVPKPKLKPVPQPGSYPINQCKLS